jgi:hypothetical protein
MQRPAATPQALVPTCRNFGGKDRPKNSVPMPPNLIFFLNAVLWNRNRRNRNLLTSGSGTGTVTCQKVKTGTVIITVPEPELDMLCTGIWFPSFNIFLFTFYNNLLKFTNQCCGFRSGIRCRFDPWTRIRDPGSQSHILDLSDKYLGKNFLWFFENWAKIFSSAFQK